MIVRDYLETAEMLKNARTYLEPLRDFMNGIGLLDPLHEEDIDDLIEKAEIAERILRALAEKEVSRHENV